jgi:hypothetical protein
MAEFKKIISSPSVRWTLTGIGVVLLFMLIFHAGFVAGMRTQFPPMPGDIRFGIRTPGFGNVELPRGFVPNGHGSVGIVQEIGTSSLELLTRDGMTLGIRATGETVIFAGREEAAFSVIKIDDQLVVLGRPEGAEMINADVIRIVPPGFEEGKMKVKIMR